MGWCGRTIQIAIGHNKWTGQESQLAGPVGYVQMQLRSWTKDYMAQIQQVVRAGPELGITSEGPVP